MMREILQVYEAKIATYLKEAGVNEPVVSLERTSNPTFGEYATNVAMRYAKELSKNPLELAEALAESLRQADIESLAKVEAVKPGFINFYLTPQTKLGHVKEIIQSGASYGSNENHADEKWVVEHTSPNPNKAMHLGHLLNNLVGMSLIRLLQKSGAEVVSDAVYNNRGIAIAKAMYGYLHHMKKEANLPTDVSYWVEHKDEWFTPEEQNMKPDLFVTECYKAGEKYLAENEEIEADVRQLVVDWEAGNQEVWELWDFVLQIAYRGIDQTLNRLDSYWDKVWFEHEHYQKGKDYVNRGLEEGVFQKLEDGAVLTDFADKYNLPDTVLLKNDGTSLYITQDIALTDLKKSTYGADKLIWVVGSEQSMAMKQLFAVCEQLGIGQLSDFTHVPYGYVGLRDEDGSFQKMSSRAGNVVLIDDVIDKVKQNIITRFSEEDRHSEENRSELAETLALAAVKFAFLKSDKKQDISFDIEESIDVQGNSGLYVMYTYVRIKSILRKANSADLESWSKTALGREAALVGSLLYFEDVVQKSVSDLSVHHVAQYLLEICSEFNSWYGNETILDGSQQEAQRLAVAKALAVTIENGLTLLGIDTVEEM